MLPPFCLPTYSTCSYWCLLKYTMALCLPLHFCILQAIENWAVRRPWNETTHWHWSTSCRLHVLCPSEHSRMWRAAEGELKWCQTGNGGKIAGKGRNWEILAIKILENLIWKGVLLCWCIFVLDTSPSWSMSMWLKCTCTSYRESVGGVLARPLPKGTVPKGTVPSGLLMYLCPLITLATTWNAWLGKALMVSKCHESHYANLFNKFLGRTLCVRSSFTAFCGPWLGNWLEMQWIWLTSLEPLCRSYMYTRACMEQWLGVRFN